jgi:hypothetical protein
VCKREGVLDADCVFAKNHFADHYRRKHLKLESKPPRSQMYTKSKYRGVQGAHGGKWRARIGSLSLGSFDTEVEAARAYDTAVLARDAGKPSNLRAKTNFGDEDHNIFPDHEKQLILQKVDAKREEIVLHKANAEKYEGVSTRTYRRVLKYRASFMNIKIELLFDTAEQAAAARDYVGMSNDSNYKRQLDKKTFEKLLTDDQKRQVNKNFLEKLAERNQKQACAFLVKDDLVGGGVPFQCTGTNDKSHFVKVTTVKSQMPAESQFYRAVAVAVERNNDGWCCKGCKSRLLPKKACAFRENNYLVGGGVPFQCTGTNDKSQFVKVTTVKSQMPADSPFCGTVDAAVERNKDGWCCKGCKSRLVTLPPPPRGDFFKPLSSKKQKVSK